jgi:hypothetical protein
VVILKRLVILGNIYIFPRIILSFEKNLLEVFTGIIHIQLN